MEDLYEGEEIKNEDEYIKCEQKVEEHHLGSEVLRSEFDKVLRELRKKGTDTIPSEILQNFGEEIEEKFFNIIKNCYYTKSSIIFHKKKDNHNPKKKGNVSDCSNY